MLPAYGARLCVQLTADSAVGLLDACDITQVAAILRCLPKSNRDSLLMSLPEKTATLSRLLLSYSEDTVGAWMSADIMMLPADCAVAEALQRIALTDTDCDSNVIPVVSNALNIVGLVNIRDLVSAEKDTKITRLMCEASSLLLSRTSLASAARHEGWQQHDTMMVLNRNRQLVGVLRHADLRRSLQRFGEISRRAPKNDLLGSISDVYAGALAAMLGLVSGQAPPDTPTLIREQQP